MKINLITNEFNFDENISSFNCVFFLFIHCYVREAIFHDNKACNYFFLLTEGNCAFEAPHARLQKAITVNISYPFSPSVYITSFYHHSLCKQFCCFFMCQFWDYANKRRKRNSFLIRCGMGKCRRAILLYGCEICWI